MQDHNPSSSGNVCVVCRFRPFNEKEKNMNNGLPPQPIHELVDSSKTVQVRELRNEKTENHFFNFDRVFDCGATQQEVYSYAAKPVVDSVLEGFNGTVFAYGQTASGKTHTMEGSLQSEPQAGIIPRMIKHVFDAISNSPDTLEFRIRVSLVQLYMEKLRDLLDMTKNDLKIRSDKTKGIYIQNLTETYISEPEEVHQMLKIAQVNRAICTTNMNERSSRSHLIFILTISQSNLQDLSAKTGKLYLVDLAGSEKVGKTGAEGKVLDEAKKINTSLTTLGKVINALTDGKSTHVPYRDSKLTRVLQQSLGGNSKTTLIVTCSPHIFNLAETISTLRFGVSAKNIKNKPKINREMTVAELQLLLQKAQSKVLDRERYITRLEDYIKVDLKARLPVETNNASGNGEAAKPDQEEVEDERIKALQAELELQRANGQVQADKINSMKRDFKQLNSKHDTLEKQNSTMLEKIVSLETRLLEAAASIAPSNKSLKETQQGSKSQNLICVSGETELMLQELQQNYEAEREKRRRCEEQMHKNEKDLRKKITSLENNIQQLTAVYYDLFVEQSKWKVENSVNLRKLERKNYIISSLENTITDLKEQLNRKQKSDEDSEDSFDAAEDSRARQIRALKQFAHKLVKPLRGGKAKPQPK